MGLALFLEEAGKDVVMFNRDPVADSYRFLPGIDRMVSEIAREARFDVSFILDCASDERVGGDFVEFAGKGRVVVIDHHPSSGSVAGDNLIQTKAAATGEILYHVMKHTGRKISSDVATALHMALMTDTGWFRFANTTAEAMRVGAEFLSAGADHALLIEQLCESFPRERFLLLSRAMQTLKFPLDGKVATIEVTQKMFDETGAGPEHTDGFVNIPRSIEGVMIAMLFRERNTDEFRVSLRSRGSVDVGKMARRFEGGGHRNAAGCTVRGDRESAYTQMVKAADEVLS